MMRFATSWRRERRNLLGDALVLVPLLIVTLTLALVFFKTLPLYEELERRRVWEGYREVARKIKDREVETGDIAYDGRKSCGQLSRGTWGWEKNGERVFIWYREPKSAKLRGIEIASVEPMNLRFQFLAWGAAILLVLLAITDLGLRRFRALVRERGDFIRATAHDLRTPIATLRLIAARLKDDQLKLLAERMHRMETNLSEFMNLGGRRPAPKSEPVDLVALAHEAYASFRDDFESDYQPVEFAGENTLSALADGDLVIQILWNLFGNELKYAAPHGKVSVSFRRESDCAIVEFTDSGPGLSASERRRIFDCCYRAPSARASGKGGFGLGLSTSRHLARLMRGELTVRPNGPGSSFCLSVPM